jgi:hypothetical protein
MAKPSVSRQDQRCVFDGPTLLGRFDVECPVCGKVSPPAWKPLSFNTYRDDNDDFRLAAHHNSTFDMVSIEWMRCAHEDCEQLIIRIEESRPHAHLAGVMGHGPPVSQSETWYARPRFGESTKEVAPEVHEPFRTDYIEAAALLDISPRMSAVLSRSILADLLETYLGLDVFSLNARIDTFRANASEPVRLREGAHHFREIGDFGSHTQKNDQDQIIPVVRSDADWMLQYLDRFFDHYIVGPEKDKTVLGKWDKNIEDAGRKPIPPLTQDPGVSSE